MSAVRFSDRITAAAAAFREPDPPAQPLVICLGNAQLCNECEVIFSIMSRRCPVCQSEHSYPIANLVKPVGPVRIGEVKPGERDEDVA